MGLEGLASSLAGFAEEASPLVDWVKDNWILLVLTGEIVGAVVAVKFGRYRRGLLWLAAALATLWLGIARSRTGRIRTVHSCLAFPVWRDERGVGRVRIPISEKCP